MSCDGDFVDAAAAIGRRIVDDAIWYDGCCSWVGAVQDPAAPWRTEYRALDATLYEGTAGVGLFLAQLAVVTGSREAEHAAIGAIRHAVVRAGSRAGFHVGTLGIAWSAARVGALLDDAASREAARRLARATHPPPDGGLDIILGLAGSIMARLALAAALEAPDSIGDALAAADELLGAATVTPEGWSWASRDRPRRRHLCGLSHGAAGIGWALLELYSATGEPRFAEAARGAFAYERSWLDRNAGTWPDLRVGGQRRGARTPLPSPAIGTWCHGEAGIALTRMRAADVLGPEPFAAEARIALETTRRHLITRMALDIEDMTLCHGASGAADVLLTAAGSAEGLPAELGCMALARHDPTGREWPCGVAAGTLPALFLGMSGIGWWFLRLADPSIQSPLTLPTRLTATLAAA